jgi:hypothetical protein
LPPKTQKQGVEDDVVELLGKIMFLNNVLLTVRRFASENSKTQNPKNPTSNPEPEP